MLKTNLKMFSVPMNDKSYTCVTAWARNICKIFSLVPSKKNCHQRKLRQTKCLLFNF